MRLLEKNNIDNNIVITIFAMILGDAVCMIIGTVQFMAVMDTGAATALSCCVMPFIIPDLVKMFVSFFVINRVKKYIKIFD